MYEDDLSSQSEEEKSDDEEQKKEIKKDKREAQKGKEESQKGKEEGSKKRRRESKKTVKKEGKKSVKKEGKKPQIYQFVLWISKSLDKAFSKDIKGNELELHVIIDGYPEIKDIHITIKYKTGRGNSHHVGPDFFVKYDVNDKISELLELFDSKKITKFKHKKEEVVLNTEVLKRIREKIASFVDPMKYSVSHLGFKEMASKYTPIKYYGERKDAKYYVGEKRHSNIMNGDLSNIDQYLRKKKEQEVEILNLTEKYESELCSLYLKLSPEEKSFINKK